LELGAERADPQPRFTIAAPPSQPEDLSIIPVATHTTTTDTRPNAFDELVQRGPETTFPNPNPARFSQLPIDPWEENIDAVDD
jgi:hypothetical protein